MLLFLNQADEKTLQGSARKGEKYDFAGAAGGVGCYDDTGIRVPVSPLGSYVTLDQSLLIGETQFFLP